MHSIPFEDQVTSFDLHPSLSKLSVASGKTVSELKFDPNLHEFSHTVTCLNEANQVVYSSTGAEIVSAHGRPGCELKLWQLDKLKDGKTWMTKIGDFTEAHQDDYLCLKLSPCGQYVAALNADQTFSIWRFFDRKLEAKKNITVDLR